MAGREVREYTNLSDPKDKKWGKGGKEKVDDEDVAFKRMVAKGFWRGTWPYPNGTHGTWRHSALDSDDLLYLKEQMEAEDDAERLRRRTEKRAFAAFRKAASIADASASSLPLPLPLRVEPKPRSGIRQRVLLKNIKPKKKDESVPTIEKERQRDYSSGSDDSSAVRRQSETSDKELTQTNQIQTGSLLGLAYENSEDERD